MIYKQDFENTKLHWRAFWEKEVIDRPALCVTSPKRDRPYHPYNLTPTISYFACMQDGWTEHLPLLEQHMESTWYGGEAIPQLDVTLGPDEYAAFLGGRLEAIRGNPTTWSVPVWNSLEGLNIAIDHTEDGYFERLRRVFRELSVWSENKCLLNMLDFHSHLDALCALRDPAETCMDIMDDPDAVVQALNGIAATYPEIFEAFYTDGCMEKRGSIGWGPTYLEKGRFAIVSCDFSCLLGAEQGKKFFLPYVEQEIDYLDRSLYHLDGKDALVHLEHLLAIEKLDCIQWVPGAGAPRSIEWMDLLKKIQQVGKSLWIFDWTPDEIRTHFRELDPAKVVFSVHCDSQDDAERLLEDIRL